MKFTLPQAPVANATPAVAPAPPARLVLHPPASAPATPAPAAGAFTLNLQAGAATAPARGLLHGTGLTKRVAEREARAHDKADERGSAIAPPTGPTHGTAVMASTRHDDIVLDESQTAAVDGLLRYNCGCLIGAAGTGKSTTIDALVKRLQALYATREDFKLSITFVAFTGRAVQNMRAKIADVFRNNCDTIHGKLEYAPVVVEVFDEKLKITRESRRFVPHRTAAVPLDEHVIIVDEGGMVPIDLWNNLMDALRHDDHLRVYLIGDIQQLPPPMSRSVLGFAMLAWPTFELTRVHRTSEDAIIGGAWDILHGRMPNDAPGRVLMQRVSDDAGTALMETCHIIETLAKRGIFDPLRDGFIVPQNVGVIGQEALNLRLVTTFNPLRMEGKAPVNPRTVIKAGIETVTMAVGDKVMVTKNDRKEGLTNGMMGVITRIVRNGNFKGEVASDNTFAPDGNMLRELSLDELTAAMDTADNAIREAGNNAVEDETMAMRQASHVVTVQFQNMENAHEFSTAGAITSLKHSYAFTCHKAQGGEFPTVVILVHHANIRMLSREWLYTAWTRAQQRIIILYSTRGMQLSLNRQVITGRTLEEKAKQFIALQADADKGADIATPDLFTPRLMGG